MLSAFLTTFIPLSRLYVGLAYPWVLPGDEERQRIFEISYPWSAHKLAPGDVLHDLVSLRNAPYFYT